LAWWRRQWSCRVRCCFESARRFWPVPLVFIYRPKTPAPCELRACQCAEIIGWKRMLPENELTVSHDSLLAFIDDTGHETFKGSKNYYALGGCVVLGAHYQWLKTQW